MSRTPNGHRGGWYEIRIQGRLDDRWSSRFDDLHLAQTADGITVFRGPVVDQAALHGRPHKLRDVGVSLLSITQTEPDNSRQPRPIEVDGPTSSPAHPGPLARRQA